MCICLPHFLIAPRKRHSLYCHLLRWPSRVLICLLVCFVVFCLSVCLFVCPPLLLAHLFARLFVSCVFVVGLSACLVLSGCFGSLDVVCCCSGLSFCLCLFLPSCCAFVCLNSARKETRLSSTRAEQRQRAIFTRQKDTPGIDPMFLRCVVAARSVMPCGPLWGRERGWVREGKVEGERVEAREGGREDEGEAREWKCEN